jgi:hypothetical protein
MQVVTSSLSLARELWRYGESELADRALRLSPGQVADIGHRAGQPELRYTPTGVPVASFRVASTTRFKGELALGGQVRHSHTVVAAAGDRGGPVRVTPPRVRDAAVLRG